MPDTVVQSCLDCRCQIEPYFIIDHTQGKGQAGTVPVHGVEDDGGFPFPWRAELPAALIYAAAGWLIWPAMLSLPDMSGISIQRLERGQKSASRRGLRLNLAPKNYFGPAEIHSTLLLWAQERMSELASPWAWLGSITIFISLDLFA